MICEKKQILISPHSDAFTKKYPYAFSK